MSQLAQMEVQDLQAEGAAPRLMMPTSRKGKGKKIAHVARCQSRTGSPQSCAC